MLQIAPSKTDAERLLVISPELADVLRVIMCRIREDTGAVPLVTSYDRHERCYNPPMPLLFQWRVRLEDRPLSVTSLRNFLNHVLHACGLSDASGRSLCFTFHDFRRIVVTDAVMHGMVMHIAQLVAGHRDINTTMGYKAVYPEEVINGHRAFIARRRASRPSQEYRTPTGEEWEEFLGHFERRKLSLGTCGRSYDTPASTNTPASAACCCAPTPPALSTCRDLCQPGRSHRRGRKSRLDRRSRRAEGQPRRRAAQAHPDGRDHHTPHLGPGASRHAQLPEYRWPHRHTGALTADQYDPQQ